MTSMPVLGATDKPTIPVSWGELIDKITILEIKETKLHSTQAVANVRQELKALTSAAAGAIDDPDLAALRSQLRSINETLWNVEDQLRAKEATRCFDRAFIELARSVYVNNDRRADLKRRINVLMKSAILEEKQYTAYGATQEMGKDRLERPDAPADGRD
jgi:hypothetical protein